MTTRYFFFVLLAVGFAGSVLAAPFTGTFTKITSTDDLTTGYYVIAASESASTSPNYIMGSTIAGGLVLGIEKSLTDSTVITNPDSVAVYLITKKGNKYYQYYSFYSVVETKYLYQTSSSSKSMGLSTESVEFTCAGYNESSPIGFKFTLNGSSNMYFKYYDETHVFANYSGESYMRTNAPVRLFKLVENPDPGSATEVEKTEMEMQAKKIVRDGQILILRGEHTYTIQGQKSK